MRRMETQRKRWPSLLWPLTAVVANLLLAYAVYFVARVAFLAENWSLFREGLTAGHLAELFGGGLVFDTSAILYTNALWVVMVLLPLPMKERPAYRTCCRWLFVVVNTVTLAINLCDAVYFRFAMRRTTTSVFDEFRHEDNLGGIFLTEAIGHWYFFVVAAVVAWVLWRLYRVPRLEGRRPLAYCLTMVLSLAAYAPFSVAGMRGGWTRAVRPITISNANQYANRPTEAALVLNTPFALLRTIGKAVFTVPDYYGDQAELEAVYTPLHVPHDSLPMRRKNVVVLIVESFGREYIGALNRSLDNSTYRGYTPQVDSILALSTTFSHSYSNGRKSIDGMPSILSSIPMFVEPFFLTPASMNHVSGLAALLAAEGYHTAFFHGANRGSMGFMAFARATGFQHYYGREDYESDPRFGGSQDFDGAWAIWDEPFLQYYCAKMSEMEQPFATAIFTASSHHPYTVPEKYKDVYPEEGIEIHKCIRYTDMALGRFFRQASKQPWFENTIFVLTSDHTNLSDHPYYMTDLGGFCSPIVIYEPGDTLRQPGTVEDKIAQQIDILPTILGMLHYPKPYLAFGIDLLATPKDDTWAVNYLNGIYQYVKHGHVLQFDGTRTKAVYSLQDSLMQHNLLQEATAATPADSSLYRLRSSLPQMERELKAIIQQYMERMTQDRLLP